MVYACRVECCGVRRKIVHKEIPPGQRMPHAQGNLKYEVIFSARRASHGRSICRIKNGRPGLLPHQRVPSNRTNVARAEIGQSAPVGAAGDHWWPIAQGRFADSVVEQLWISKLPIHLQPQLRIEDGDLAAKGAKADRGHTFHGQPVPACKRLRRLQ